RLVVFEALEESALRKIIDKASSNLDVSTSEVLKPESLEALIQISSGDARRLLNFFDQIVKAYRSSGEFSFPLDVETLKKLLGHVPLYHDKSAEAHYDTISAFIKSIRGSDA